MSMKTGAFLKAPTAPVPVPLDPDVLQGPLWLRGPRPGVLAQPTAVDPVEPTAVAPVASSAAAAVEPAAVAPATAPVASAAPDARGEMVAASDVGDDSGVLPVASVAEVRAAAVRAVVGVDAAIASLQAMRTHLLAGLGRVALDEAAAERLDSGIAIRDLANELALQERRSDRTVEAEIGQAIDTVDRWPATLRAWGAATIGRGHVAVIAELGAPLQTPEARAAFEQALLPHAATTTPGRLRAIARRQLAGLLEQPLAERHRTARDDRSVSVTDLDDGMSLLRAYVPTVLAQGMLDRVTQLARAATDTDDARTIDQRRADALCDLVLTGEPTDTALRGIRAQVSIVIPATVLTGDDHGGGPHGGGREDARLRTGQLVDPDTARQLAGMTKLWTRVFTHPVTGHVVAVDTYRPPRKLRALLRERDQRCRWPGCTGRAEHADLDHTIPWADGGTTALGNLAHLCRRHHMLKGATLAHGRRWRVRQFGHGALEWTSPDGHVYVDQPDPVGPTFTDSPTEGLWGTSDGPMPDAPF